MKFERVSAHIWSLASWMLIPVRVWAVEAEDGVTLVDAGLPFMADGILRFIAEMKAGPLRRILLTHGHSDHVGALKGILARTPVPVFAHRIELPYMEGRLPYPRRRRSEANVGQGVAQPLAEAEGDALERVAGLRPCLTPGHSPGHVAYYHEEDQVLLGGDLFTSRRGRLRKPMAMFTGDMAEAVRSGKIVGELTPRRLEICHGGSVMNPADQLEEYLKAAGVSLAN